MSNHAESYQHVLEVITDVNFDNDAKAILIQIAKTHPQIVVDAACFIKSDRRMTGMSKELMAALRAGCKIEAIKQYRYDTGASLKDAKDAVEEVIARNPELMEMFKNI
jgi:ribosomal protein L7/L12